MGVNWDSEETDLKSEGYITEHRLNLLIYLKKRTEVLFLRVKYDQYKETGEEVVNLPPITNHSQQ